MQLNNSLNNIETINITDKIELNKIGNIVQISIKSSTSLPNSIVIPEGYRPKYNIYIPCVYSNGTSMTSGGNVAIGIQIDGTLGLFARGVSTLTNKVDQTSIIYIVCN